MDEKRDGAAQSLMPVFVGVVALFATTMLLVLRAFQIQPTGDLGDDSSLVGALFSALAFGGVVVAILLQRQELRLQRDELSMTRAELEGQRVQLAAQNRTMSWRQA